MLCSFFNQLRLYCSVALILSTMIVLDGFSLSTKGHGECVKFVRDLNVPLLAVGGGG